MEYELSSAIEVDASQVGVAPFPSFSNIFYHFTFPGFPFVLPLVNESLTNHQLLLVIKRHFSKLWVSSSNHHWIGPITWHNIYHWFFFLFEGNQCGLHHVHPKKLLQWLYWWTNPPWPSLVPIHQRKPNVLSTSCPLMCFGESMFHPWSQNIAKFHPCCGWTRPNTPSKLSHDYVSGPLWENVASILQIAFKYPRDHSKTKPLSHVICLWLPKSPAIGISNQPTPYREFFQLF